MAIGCRKYRDSDWCSDACRERALKWHRLAADALQYFADEQTSYSDRRTSLGCAIAASRRKPSSPWTASVSRWQLAQEIAYLFQDGILVAGPEPMVIAVERDEPRSGDRIAQMAACLDAHGAIAAAMQDEGGRPDPRQQGAHVGIAQGFENGLDRAGAGGSAQQARPLGLRLPVADEARRERADFRRPIPILDQPAQPDIILVMR
jgi:hypothetical protein